MQKKKQKRKGCMILVVLLLCMTMWGCAEKNQGWQVTLETAPAETVPSSVAETAAEIWVYICGAVSQPGVYSLKEGARLYQLLELAGGATAEGALEAVNLAALLTDGQKVVIPTWEQVTDPAWTENEQGEGVAERKVNINNASAEELMTLPGIGASRAAAIIQYREEQGPFQSIEQIMEVSGIKEGAFQKIQDKICI